VKIKKTRLLQIIQEEIASIDEVDVARRGRKDKELELYDRWRAGDDDAFTELYAKIKPGIEKFLMKKAVRTSDLASIEDTAQNVFLKLLEKPEIFGGRSALSSFLKGNALNQTLDKFRSVVKFGGTPLSGDNFTDVSDAAQKAGETLSVRDISGGSRNLDPERKAIFKDLFDKLQKDDPIAAKAFMLSYMGYTHQEIIDMDDATPSSQAAVSRGVNKASEFLGDLYKGNLEEGETADRMFDDAEAIRADEKQFFEDFYKWAYDNYGSMVEDGELDDELLAVYRKVLAKSEDPDAELMEPDPYDDYESLPKQGSMGGSSPNPTPATATQRGSMFPRRQRNPVPRNEELSLEETIAAVVKETLGL
jgi:DNA-directed RNA polymerase specialized sigma24 family protein